ncbi:MAG: hypothetical protein O7G84_10830 [Gammaproteobacteria bacterium]|nr:hypothetical protein [Gammaproteobacteria bacterium]
MIQILRADDFVFREVEDADLSQMAAWIRGDSELDFFERHGMASGSILTKALKPFVIIGFHIVLRI